jgi:glycine/D-amino acid oxidase-like deaminating enzyme
MARVTAYDAIILGQGLAGTTLAWQLHWLGQRVLVLDREPASSSSRIAAGLITPITGQRLAKTPQIDELFPAAEQFYRRVEAVLGDVFFHRRCMVRLFLSEPERAVYEGKVNREFVGWVAAEAPLLAPEWFAVPHGAFEMTPAGQLDVPGYLTASRAWFQSRGQYHRADVDWTDDIALSPGSVRLSRLGVEARVLIFAQGFHAEPNPWFPELEFQTAKGEILTLQIPGLWESRVINRGGTWLAPVAHEIYRAGSTYDRDNLDDAPTPAGRDEILGKLSAFLRLPVRVLEHRAAVRPITPDRVPVCRFHSQYPQLALLNGLASKGSLFAPSVAERLALAVAGQAPLS